MKSWFSDVWAEVTWASGNMFKYVHYEKGGETRYSRIGFVEDVRKVIKKSEVEARLGEMIRGVLHSHFEYFGAGHKHWTYKMRNTATTRNPERWEEENPQP